MSQIYIMFVHVFFFTYCCFFHILFSHVLFLTYCYYYVHQSTYWYTMECVQHNVQYRTWHTWLLGFADVLQQPSQFNLYNTSLLGIPPNFSNNNNACHLDTHTYPFNPQKELVSRHALRLPGYVPIWHIHLLSHNTSIRDRLVCKLVPECAGTRTKLIPSHAEGHVVTIPSTHSLNAHTQCRNTCQWTRLPNPRVHAKSAHTPSDHQWDWIKIDWIPGTCQNTADTCPMDMYHLETHAGTACTHTPEYALTKRAYSMPEFANKGCISDIFRNAYNLSLTRQKWRVAS